MSGFCFCRECGYDLRDLPAGPCPECGIEFDPAVPASFRSVAKPLSRYFGWWQIVFAVYPLLWLAWFYVMMGIARIELGHWPMVYRDHPDFFGLRWVFEGGIASCALAPLASALSMCMGLMMVIRAQTSWSVGLIRVWLCLPAWALTIWVLRIDPGGCVEWFFD